MEQRMKQTLRRELTNIVFLVLIVAAAVVIYLLSRAEINALAPETSPTPTVETAASQAGEEAEATASVAPGEEDKSSSTTRGVPESVFETHLKSSSLYTAEHKGGKKTAYTITWEGDPPVEAALVYELIDGKLSSLEITFQLPAPFKGKPTTEIEKRLFEASDKGTRATEEAIPELLSDLFSASDARSELQQTSIRFWTDQILFLKKPGDKFEDSLGGYHFIGFRRQGDILQELVCILFLS
jgi:cytoskeletal protein RodZ